MYLSFSFGNKNTIFTPTGVHVEDYRLLPLRYNISQSPAQKRLEVTNPRDTHIHNLRAYFSISSPEERMSQRVDFLASDVVHPCYLVASSPLNCQRHAKAITLHLIATLYSSLLKSISGTTALNTTPLQKIHCLATTPAHIAQAESEDFKTLNLPTK